MPVSSYLDTAPALADGVYLHPSAQVIGDVVIGEESSVWCNAVIRGDVNRIRIGRGSNIQDLSMVHVSHRSTSKPEGSPTRIGDYVTVGHSVILHGCDIGDECLIGMGSIVMDDAVIEAQVILGAGSLVPSGKRLAGGHLYMGRPAAPVRPLTDEEKTFLRYSAEHYIRVKNNHIQSGLAPLTPPSTIDV
jgi:carbonic anhydrase/acetyltransferase-like protein (isoleucine patch superfamily)